MAPWVTRICARSAASPWRTGSIAGVALLVAKPNGANICPKKKHSRRGIDQRTYRRWDRPELHRLLDQLRKGDVLVVWRLGRLSRSLRDVLMIVERIQEAN